MSQQASHHLYAIIFKYLTLKDLKNCLFLDRRFHHHANYYLHNCLNLTLNIPQIKNDLLYLKDLISLRSLTINCINLSVKKFQIILQQIPKQVRKLHLLVEIQIFCHQNILFKLPKYIGEEQDVNLRIKDICNKFYLRMTNLKKFKLDNLNLLAVQDLSFASLFYYALFYKSDKVLNVPCISSVSFSEILQYDYVLEELNSNLHQNPHIKNFSIKQKEQTFGIEVIDHLQYFLLRLLPPTLSKLTLTQHSQQNYKLQPLLYQRLIQQFQQLECLKINIYQGNLTFGTIYDHNQIEVTNGSLTQLGLASIRCNPWNIGQLIIRNPNIKVLNLDFAQLDDNFLLQINNFQLVELTIRGNNHLNSQSLDYFLYQQKELRVLDIRGVYQIKKKTLKSIIQNNFIEKLKLSDNKFNNRLYLMMLQKFQNCLKSLHLGSLRKNHNFTPDVLQQTQFIVQSLLSLTIFISTTAFLIKDLRYLLQTFPLITNLNINISQQGPNNQIITIIKEVSSSINQLKIEKLTLNDNSLFIYKSSDLDEYQQCLKKLKQNCPLLRIISITSRNKYDSLIEVIRKEGIFVVNQKEG
ncbi:hypothetical protein pb186bvf_019112 [Paramecium bursaria]